LPEAEFGAEWGFGGHLTGPTWPDYFN